MIYSLTSAGPGKTANEDSLLIGTILQNDSVQSNPLPAYGFVSIADGVGGNAGGSIASRKALTKLASLEEDSQLDVTALRNYILEINKQLINEARAIQSCETMATTLTGVLLSERNNFLFHVGNTRAYILQGSYLKQLTDDHTVFSWLMRTGRINEAECCNKNEITNCLGGGNEQLASALKVVDLPKFNTLLLTSDGVHEYVDIDTLEETINAQISGDEKCSLIEQYARNNGSQDDVSIVLISQEE